MSCNSLCKVKKFGNVSASAKKMPCCKNHPQSDVYAYKNRVRFTKYLFWIQFPDIIKQNTQMIDISPVLTTLLLTSEWITTVLNYNATNLILAYSTMVYWNETSNGYTCTIKHLPSVHNFNHAASYMEMKIKLNNEKCIE